MPKPRAPRNCYWRGNIIWAKKRVAGAVHRFSLNTDNPSVAAARVRAFTEKQIARERFGDDRKTWGEALEAWCEWFVREKPFSASTYDRYLVSIEQLAPFLDGCYLDEIDRAKINEIVSGRRSRRTSVATVRRDLTALSSVLANCEDEEWRDDNPALAKLRNKRFRERRDPIVLPDPDHIRMAVMRAPGLLAKMAQAALATGCRQNELVTAMRSGLDHDRMQLTVLGKRNRRRTIDLSTDAYEILRNLPTHLRCKWLFWHDDGEPYRNVASRFRAIVLATDAAAQKSGTDFRPFRFHDLRHRHAVDYLKNGGNIYILQGHLGHKSIKTTELYLEFLSPEEKLASKYGTRNAAQVQRSENKKTAENA